MANTPRVSIGLPVFNGARYLEQTLDSIQDQDLTDWELVIADNASSDGTREICISRASTDGRIRYVRNATNLGGPQNYNLVFSLARAPLFKWSSSNDLIAADMLSRCVKILDENEDAVLAYALTCTFDEDVRGARPYPEEMALAGPSPFIRFKNFLEAVQLNNIMNGVIRSAVLRQTCLHRTFYSSDVCMVAELALRGRLIQVPETTFYRRMARDARVDAKDTARILAHWTPELKQPPGFQSWGFLRSLASAAVRVRLGLLTRARILLYVARLAYWSKRKLTAELIAALRIG